jgi:hypothetical protein
VLSLPFALKNPAPNIRLMVQFSKKLGKQNYPLQKDYSPSILK